MLALRRSEDNGRTFGPLSWPYLPGLARHQKADGQMLWDDSRRRLWLFFAVFRDHSPNTCMGDGENPQGLMLMHSTDLGRSFSRPLNLSAQIQRQWPSLCVAPAAGDAALDLGAGHLLFMANVVGNDPDAPTGGEILIHATGEAEALNFTVSRSLLRACTSGGQRCDYNEASMAVVPSVPPAGEKSGEKSVFVVMRSDPALTHTYATALSTDSGYTFGSVTFRPDL